MTEVKKVKIVSPDFHDGSGPSETISLGLEVDGDFVMFGRYYLGPGMIKEHEPMSVKMELFIDECVNRFKD